MLKHPLSIPLNRLNNSNTMSATIPKSIEIPENLFDDERYRRDPTWLGTIRSCFKKKIQCIVLNISLVLLMIELFFLVLNRNSSNINDDRDNAESIASTQLRSKSNISDVMYS